MSFADLINLSKVANLGYSCISSVYCQQIIQLLSAGSFTGRTFIKVGMQLNSSCLASGYLQPDKLGEYLLGKGYGNISWFPSLLQIALTIQR